MPTALATPELILDAEFDQIRFEGHVDDGRLVLDGVLADQEQLDSIPVGIYVMERDGTVVACNATAIEAWGRTPEPGAVNVFRHNTDKKVPGLVAG